MGSAWLDHVKQTGGANPDVMKQGGFKAILKLAGQTWKKGTGVVSSVGKATKSVVKGTTNSIGEMSRTAANTLKMKKIRGTRKVKGKGTRRKGKGKGKGKGTRRKN